MTTLLERPSDLRRAHPAPSRAAHRGPTPLSAPSVGLLPDLAVPVRELAPHSVLRTDSGPATVPTAVRYAAPSAGSTAQANRPTRPTQATRATRARPVRGGCAHDAPRPIPRPSTPGAGLHVTRRGRLLVSLCTLLVAVVLLAVATTQAGSSGGGLSEAPATVVVQQGDTLWQIATSIAPADNPAMVVSRLQEANGLGTEALRPGQVLQVPTD